MAKGSSRRWLAPVLVLGTLSTGCKNEEHYEAPDSAQAICQDMMEAGCELLHACFSGEQLADAGYGYTVEECARQMGEEAGCPEASTKRVCDAGMKYHPKKVEECLDQMSSPSCESLSEEEFSAPACEEICTEE